MKKISAVLFFTILTFVKSNAQSLAINTDGSSASASALLDVKSNSKGMLIPRMSKLQKTLIPTPAIGLLIFQNSPDSIGFHYYDGSNWVWLANSEIPQNWLLTGNSNVTGSSYLGTSNMAELRFGVNGFERGRINPLTGFWGFGGETNPQYDMDMILGSAAFNPCNRNGIRLKPVGFSNLCDNGLFMGLDVSNSIANASIWNYGNSGSGAQNLRIGLNTIEVTRFNSYGFQGLGETDPLYTFDMRLGTAGVIPCIRNGIRINNISNNNACDKGLFVGYDMNNIVTDASLWNFGDGSFGNSLTLRFGLGNDFTNGERMRITSNGVGIGSTSPIATLHIINRTGVLFPGVMVTNTSLPASTNGFYSGLKDNSLSNTGRIWNYQNADIELGTNDIQRMIIASSGNIGVGASATPTSSLHVDGTFAVGVTMNIGGGFSGSPTLIDGQKSYLGLTPFGGFVYYLLPNPAGCAGRIYYIRNNDDVLAAQLGTNGGLICPGNGSCLAPGAYYQLNPGSSVKTVIAISDGVNWTVGKID